MRQTPHRHLFDASNYKRHFLKVMEDFHSVMINHNGTLRDITAREYTVEISYLLPRPDQSTTLSQATVVLYISHNKYGVFTKQHLGGAADKPLQFKLLKAEIDRVAAAHSSRAADQLLSSLSRPDVNVFNEIRNALERLECEELSAREMRHALKFTGTFNGTPFMLNVYTMKDGRLKTRNCDGVKEECVNPVWDRPQRPPARLKNAVEDVIRWIKAAEAGSLTSSEIEAGPNVSTELDSLTQGISNLSL